MKISFQGDRNIVNNGWSVKCLREIARGAKRHGHLAFLGAYGDVAQVVAEEMGPEQTTCHGHRAGEAAKCPVETTFVDCAELAARLGQSGNLAVAWGIRLGFLVGEADAFIIFRGREGTLAHLSTAFAFAKKAAEKGTPKKIALVLFSQEEVDAILTLWFGGRSECLPDWVLTFPMHEQGDESIQSEAEDLLDWLEA